MRTFFIPVFALGLIVGVLLVTKVQFGEPEPGIGPGGVRVLVIYDVPTPAESIPEQLVSPYSVVQLLGHFDVNVQMVSTADYEKGQLSKAAFGIYVGSKTDQPLTTYLLDDIADSNRPFMWIGANLDRLQERRSMDPYGIKLADSEDRYATNEVVYKGQKLAKIDLKTFKVDVERPSVVQVLAEAKFVENPIKPAVAGLPDEPGTPERMAPDVIGSEEPLPAGLPPLPVVEDATGAPRPPKGKSGELIEALTPTPVAELPPPPLPPAGSIPWIVRGGQFWYVASDPIAYHIEGGAYLAFADALHDFLGQAHETEYKALLRLEDVHPKRETATLRKAADLLFERGVPFTFTLVPVYRNEATDETIYLSQSGEFLETVKYMISKGGTPILHGYTHQHSGESAVDFEFWSGTDGGHPIAGEEKTYASARVEQALSECFLNEIYPLAWTTPHYAAGQTDYDVFSHYFTTVVERRMPVEWYGSDQFFPYFIRSDLHKQFIVPESLGYVNPAAGRDPAALLLDADAMKVVRDGWASFFFHTFLDLSMLTEIVDGIEQRGFRFVSLTELNNKVTTKDRVVVSGVNEVKLTLDTQYRHEKTYNRFGVLEDENFSFGSVKGDVQSLVTLREDEFQVIEGVYRRPPITLAHINQFRPTISGVTNPVAIVLLFIGMFTLIVFVGIWVFLVTRRTLSGARRMVRHQGKEY